MDIDTFRKRHLAVAELIDAWRVVPRMLVAAYSYLVWDTVQWYEALKDPTTQHAALVTAVVGAATIVFGMYTNSGRTWGTFTPWTEPKAAKSDKVEKSVLKEKDEKKVG